MGSYVCILNILNMLKKQKTTLLFCTLKQSSNKSLHLAHYERGDCLCTRKTRIN